MSHFWCGFICPPFVLMINRASKSCLFNTYFGFQNTVSVDSLFNMISYFIFSVFMNEQYNPSQQINGSSFSLDKMFLLVLLSS